MNKLTKILTILIITIFAITAVSAADNSTDDNIGIEDASNEIVSLNTTGTFTDLSNEIDEVEDGGVLNITKDYIYESGSKDGITINKSITINGNNHKIDGNGQSRIFSTYDGNITLKNLILINGNHENGGAIHAHKNITCSNVVFENNHAAKNGGAIYVETGLNVDNCIFDGNFAPEGGVIFIKVRAIENYTLVGPGDDSDYLNDTGNYTYNETDDDNENFTEGNESSSYDDSLKINFYIENSIFRNTNNITRGMVYCSSDQHLSVKNSIFMNSTAAYSTAIYATNSYVTCNNTKFINLYATKTAGALAFTDTCYPTIDNCSFVNVSSLNNAGCILNDVNGWSRGNAATLLINNTEFINSHSRYGGALIQLGGKLEIRNSKFINNSAVYSGGAIYTSNLIVQRVNLTDITSTKTIEYPAFEIVNSTFTNNKLDFTDDLSNGGAICADTSILNITGSRFINNTKNAIYVYSGGYIIKNSVFENNTEAVHSLYIKDSILNDNDYADDILVENLTDTNYVLIMNGTGLKIKLINNTVTVENLPARYDSRDWGWVSSIKDQGFSGGCWVFSTCSALETALLKSTGIEYDLSIQNIQKNLLKYSKYGNSDITESGFTYMALSYLLGWYGPISTEYDSFDIYGKIDHVIFTNETIHIQDAEIIDRRANTSDNAKIKEAILKYGAVTGDLFITYASPYFNTNTSAWYYNGTKETHASHAICVVGWDDNYPASNFLITPPGNGAWIIKNSYGKDKYDNGFIYVSYYDTVFGNDSQFIGFILENTENYNKNYQTDISGMFNFETKAENYTYKNSYQSIGDDFISAVGTYFNEKNEDYVVEIYVNNKLKLTQNGSSPFRGFHTIKLSKSIPIKQGDIFTVVMKTHSVPLLNETRVLSKANVSFVDDGTGFRDVTLKNQALPLKVYTKPLENLTTTIKASDVTTVYNGGKYLTATVKDVYGDVLTGVKVTIKLSNGAVKTLKTNKNGQVKLPLNGLVPKTYTATITVNGFGKYVKTTATAKITVKKDTPKISAKAKTFKQSLKTKKYTVTLKNSKGKIIKKLKVTLKVNGKTYVAKTNSKGKVTFKITKLSKKGTFKGKLTFNGNTLYKKATKTVKIKIK